MPGSRGTNTRRPAQSTPRGSPASAKQGREPRGAQAVLNGRRCNLLSSVGGDGTLPIPVLPPWRRLNEGWSDARANRAGSSMRKYRDVLMDYADAILVALAEELDTSNVFTLDLWGPGPTAGKRGARSKFTCRPEHPPPSSCKDRRP